MNNWDLVIFNFTSPIILCFFLGLVAGFLKSDLKFPEGFSKILAIYLMFSIGLKGGHNLSNTSIDISLLVQIVFALIASFGIPLIAYSLLKFFKIVDNENAAVIAAHYGSVSIVTFAVASQILEINNVLYGPQMIVLAALMETPAIVSGLYLLNQNNGVSSKLFHPRLSREIFLNGSVVLLVGGFMVGYLSNINAFEQVKPLFFDPFKGILCLFLLEMGLYTSKRISISNRLNFKITLFGLFMPILSALLGLGISAFLHFSIGNAFLFIVLSASASYIAVPAAMRIAAPRADAALAIVLALGITFPFNIVLGIPLYLKILQILGWQ